MNQQPSLIATDVDYEAEGFQHGHLRLPWSHDRSGYGHIPIPVAVLKRGVGPTLLLTGGNHGDEYEGPVALMNLVRRMPAMELRGRLIVVPGLNLPALLNGSRTSPIDGANLNRVFPGARNGTLTEMIAHYADTELFPRADLVFDLHAGGLSTNYLPTLLASPPADAALRRRYRGVVEAFGAPRVMLMDLLGEDRTYGAAVERHGIPFLCGEFGGHAVCSPEGLALVERGIQGMLGALDMCAAPAAPALHARPRFLRVDGAKHYAFAPCAGIFEPAFRLGDEIAAGQLAGRIHDPRQPLAPPVPVHFAGAGLAICIRALARVEPGDCLGHLAAEVDWQGEGLR